MSNEIKPQIDLEDINELKKKIDVLTIEREELKDQVFDLEQDFINIAKKLDAKKLKLKNKSKKLLKSYEKLHYYSKSVEIKHHQSDQDESEFSEEC